MAVTMKIAVSKNVTMDNVIDSYQYFRWTFVNISLPGITPHVNIFFSHHSELLKSKGFLFNYKDKLSIFAY